MNALLWKEFKEIWRIWLIAICSIILFLVFAVKSTEMLGAVCGFLSVSFVVLYGGFAGARSFSSEQEKGTFTYLLTRPIRPINILFTKYTLGCLQVVSLFLTVLLTVTFLQIHKDYYHECYDAVTQPPFWIALSILISYYTLCFLISIVIGDTVRSFLIGFTITLVSIGMFVYTNAKHTLSDELFYIYYGLYFPPAFIFVLGLIGITYYTVLRKRLVWKSGFTLLLLLGIYIYHYDYDLLYGNMKPVGWTKKIQLLDQNNMVYGAGYQFHYFNNKVYAFGFLSKDSVLQLIAVDVSNPRHPKEKPVLKLPPHTWNPRFDDNKLYTIENSNPGQLVVYDLQQGEAPKIIQRIPLPSFDMDTTLNPKPPLPFIRTSDHYVYLEYSINTGWEYRDTNYQLTTQQAYERSTSVVIYSRKDVVNGRYHLPFAGIHKQSSYKQHILQFDKTNNKIINQFDLSSSSQWQESPFASYFSRFSSNEYLTKWNRISTSSLIEIYSASDTTYSHKLGSLTFPMGQIISNRTTASLLSFQIKGKYLYALTIDHPLEVYDLTESPNPKLISSSDWNWLDKTILKENSNPYLSRWLGIKGNRLTISYERGLLFYDISNPTHPHVTGRLFSEQISHYYDIHGDYLYNYGPTYGFSIFKLPEVKS